VSGLRDLSQEQFSRLMSQVAEISNNPKRPIFPENVEILIEKARQSAISAIQVYNNPLSCFKTETYAVLMMVAWTALAQAEFTRDDINFDRQDKVGAPILVDGEPKAWELAESLEHMKNLDEVVKKNIEFFIKLRNWVVHRGVKEIDSEVAGECQALLLNFDQRLVDSFGKYYAVSESLALPLITSNVRDPSLMSAVKAVHRQNFDEVMKLVSSYRMSLDNTIYEDQRYSFRVFVMPRTGNRQSTSDYAIEFVRFEDLGPDVSEELKSKLIAVRSREVPVHNKGSCRPQAVVDNVARQSGLKFNITHHTNAWKKYEVRPRALGSSSTNSKYCLLDEPTNTYIYTKEWIAFLVEKLKDPQERKELGMKD
jgi:hypothetical protein